MKFETKMVTILNHVAYMVVLYHWTSDRCKIKRSFVSRLKINMIVIYLYSCIEDLNT